MSLQGIIQGTGRLHSELCPWGVNHSANLNNLKYLDFWFTSDFNTTSELWNEIDPEMNFRCFWLFDFFNFFSAIGNFQIDVWCSRLKMLIYDLKALESTFEALKSNLKFKITSSMISTDDCDLTGSKSNEINSLLGLGRLSISKSEFLEIFSAMWLVELLIWFSIVEKTDLKQ